ncbi:MAG: type II toxin-antitoxin system PemK/MazF family toxin [Deltaproteobacteria bacterium]|nr:type II toxin-antitoxin system PemK/MazF family toxin [Deltaproteobacteria bacterium]
MKIKRWGIYLVNLDPNIGTKPGKVRPAVVVQSDIVNDTHHPSTVILPISSKTRNKDQFPLRVFIEQTESGLEKDSVILVDQILAWDNRRFIKQIGMLSRQKSQQLESAIRDFFEL